MSGAREGGALPAGSLIGIVAPAGPTSAERLAQVPPLFEAAGYRARLYPGCGARHGELPYLAGDDAARLADLHAALADDEVAAILCLRGGYGCMRLVDRVDTALVRARRKLLVGYSDITALLALWACECAPALHAPMATSDLVLPERAADREALFWQLRRGVRAGDVFAAEATAVPAPLCALTRPGVAEGRLVGGNLSLVAALQGTPFAWPAQGTLLFLEEVSEEPYRIDRLLTQLHLAGVLGAAAGFVLGSFTHPVDPAAVLRERLGPLGKPMLAGWPSGHGTPNRPLPLGLRARLDAGARTLTLLEGWPEPA
ncbi:MAG: LD-carboxypeptidase [Burkholderiales bacterium]|nr:LD-carboxypeptidase [Burkholderiales bacterium]